MTCLCCGKPLTNENIEISWHSSCIKKFFGTAAMPYIDISEEALQLLAIANIDRGFTVPGVQKKLSLHLTAGADPHLTLVNYPTGYILKPQTVEYSALPELEFLIMQMANATKIKCVPFALLRIPSQNNSLAYITKRIDRVKGKILAMEDFCQLDGRLTEDKYRGSYERCAKVINKYSSVPGADMTELFLRIVFSFAVGNSDMHLKNFSLIETKEGSELYTLSAAYDMLSSNIAIPADKEQLALTLNGKKHNIRRKDFLRFAETSDISEISANRMIEKVVKLRSKYIEMCRSSYLPDCMKTALEDLITRRIDTLRGCDQ